MDDCSAASPSTQRLLTHGCSLSDRAAAAGIEVLYDDRDARPGVKFADMELLGIPHRIVISDRGLEDGKFEYKYRRSSDKEEVAADSVTSVLLERLNSV